MKLLLIAIVLLLGAANSTFAQNSDACSTGNIVKLDGECWRSLAAIQKNSTIRGMWMGNAASRVSMNLVDQSPTYFMDKDWFETPESTTIGDISQYFDRLYETPANRKILWHWAYILAAMNARDDDSDDRLSLLRFLRQHDSVPTSGVLVGAKSADTIIVRNASGTTFDVHLAGVSVEGLSENQKKKITSFINGLTTSAYADCTKTYPTDVSLKFTHSMFQGDNRLSATAIIKAPIICIGSVSVSTSQINGGGTTLYLNALLVRKGLAKPSNYVDPKWPDIIAKYNNYQWASNNAREASLYIHGDKKDALVERISAAGNTR